MTDQSTSPWSDSKKWRDQWEVIENLTGGGQGDAFRARRTIDGREGFLKVLKARGVAERRARFFREATAYDSFAIDGIPRLIESNAQHHAELTFDPYIVTEFVAGPTLTAWRSNNPVSMEDAVAVTRRILEILRDCHDEGCIHRDVKPDNIILEDCAPDRASLLDFGLSYHSAADPDFRTEDGQEVGNRFLRLNELSAGSTIKQDPRSDLAFAAGILFFLLVGQHPDQLQDAEGRLPHQRSAAFAALQTMAGVRLARLIAFFDNSFAPLIEARFSNATVMLAALDQLMTTQLSTGSPDDDLAAIRSIIDTAAERRRIDTNQRLSDAIRHIGPVFRALYDEMDGAFLLSQSNQRIEADFATTTYSWTRVSAEHPFLTTTCEAIEIGDEIVIRLSSETIYRTPLAAVAFTSLGDAIRPWLLAKIRAALVDPDILPAAAEFFVETAPLARLEAAGKKADESGKLVLAFVYDPTLPEQGKISHGLRYFLQNRRTRDAMNATFVTALVPLSQLRAYSDILDAISMEESHWVVLDAHLKAIEQQTIYANGSEGERIMVSLTDRHRRPSPAAS